MNLCGGIAGVSEHELAFRFPDEEFSLSSRKKSSSSSSQSLTGRRDKSTSGRYALKRQSSSSSRHSARSSRGGVASSSQSLTSTSKSKASALKSIGRHDYEKQRTRNRSRQGREIKGSSILSRKLDLGFNLTWINGGGKTQAVNLSTNSDKSYLRIRIRPRDENGSENDGSKGNQRDVKMKVRHIAKIGSEVESASAKRREAIPSKKSNSNSFIIKMKPNVCEFNKLKFTAQSLAERDSVVLAIRSLMGQGKHTQQGSLPSKNRSDESSAQQVNVVKIHRHGNDKVREDTDSLDIPAPHDFGDDERFRIESRDDNLLERAGDSERDAVDEVDKQRNSSERQDSLNKSNDNSLTYKHTVQNISSTAKQHRRTSSTWMDKKNHDIEARKSKKSIVTSTTKSRQHRSSLKLNNNKQRSRSPQMLEHQRNDVEGYKARSVMKKVSDPLLFEESIRYNRSQSRPALMDEDIADLGADFPTTGPWCTDDVCTASLKDFADSMTGIFDLKESREMKGLYTTNKNQRAIAEEYITGFLSNNTNMSELLSVKDLWNVAATKHATGKVIKKMRLHNRARQSNGKAIRISNLRKQMTFHGADTENLFLETISSFDDIKRKERVDVDNCELLYYDSDPEGARERIHRKGPRVATARRKQQSRNQSNGKRRQALDILDMSRFGLGRKWKRLGQDVLTDIIEAIKNEKLILLWHPTQNDKSDNMPPVCVKVWVESGIYLADGSFLLPKLTWLPAHEKDLERRVLNGSDNNPGSLDLLDVCRVRECQSIDRGLHPFANVDRSFIIQTQNGRFMFEAQSKQERGRIVNGLKLVIARLASLLMLKDLRAVDEFFGGNAVPGEAPVWARGHDKNDLVVDFPTA